MHVTTNILPFYIIVYVDISQLPPCFICVHKLFIAQPFFFFLFCNFKCVFPEHLKPTGGPEHTGVILLLYLVHKCLLKCIYRLTCTRFQFKATLSNTTASDHMGASHTIPKELRHHMPAAKALTFLAICCPLW